MNKMISLFALTAISMPAMAADKDAFYGSLGSGIYRLQSEGFDDSAPTAMILGGYKVNEFVAIEAAYSRLFEASDTVDDVGIEVDGDVWDLSTKLSFPLGERFSPYVRLGWSYVDLSALAWDDDVAVRANEYEDAFSWAVGTGIKLNKRLAINGDVGRVDINDGDFDRLSLNLSYAFGAH